MGRLVILTSLILLTACAPALVEQELIERLSGRGVVSLSGNNPFLAANLLISRISERSAEVKGFIAHRGMPAAVEVEDSFFQPTLMRVYYPDRSEQFTFEELSDGWIIGGPSQLDPDKLAAVRQATSAQPEEPIRLAGTPLEQTPKAERRAGFQSPALPTPAPTASISKLRETGEESQLKALIAKAPEQRAETTPRGDLVHYVTLPGETLSLIARWYTLDRANAGRLARMNQLIQPNQLAVGDTIVVPSYLVRNDKRLDSDSLRELQRVVSR